jgi:hypothetical protein
MVPQIKCAGPLTVPSLCGVLLQAGPVIDAGGIFEFARNSGMIKAAV